MRSGGWMEVKTIVVIGAGPTGCDIAYAAVLGGYVTVLEDLCPEALEKAVAYIRQLLDRRFMLGEAESGIRGPDRALLSTASEVQEAIRDADLIIEAVAEEMEMKLELFTIFDKFAKPGAIFASASSLSVTEMSDLVVHRERCIGLRFSTPALRPLRLELVRTPFTSEETVAACREVARRLGREVVAIKGQQQLKEVTNDARDSLQTKAG